MLAITVYLHFVMGTDRGDPTISPNASAQKSSRSIQTIYSSCLHHQSTSPTDIMSFPASLKPAARSAYRSVVRAARVTFQDDPARFAQLINAVRPTFESPTLTDPAKPPPPPLEGPAPDLSAPEEIAKRIQEWQEVAVFLRKNVVQGRLDQESGRYSEYQ